MTTYQGNDDQGGFGVLGTGTPWSYQDPQDDSTVQVTSAGVWGLLGTKDDISNIIDEVTNNPGSLGQPVNAAFAGRNALSSGGVAMYGETRTYLGRPTMIGFLAGIEPKLNQNAGVGGWSSNGVGVVGRSDGGDGISGHTWSQSFNAIFGWNHSTAPTPAGGPVPVGNGIWGATDVPNGSGVVGTVGPNNTTGAGVTGMGNDSGALAGLFYGNVQVKGDVIDDLRVRGDVYAYDVHVPGSDCAEHFDIAFGRTVEPGTVMAINDEGSLVPCERAYDKRVAGVISGAGPFKAGIILGEQGGGKSRMPLALIGKVYCKVDANYAPVVVGDLLTTSPTSGHAMKAEHAQNAFGAVIGKALQAMGAGQGLIPILIALQ
jgi:hypothetical protein